MASLPSSRRRLGCTAGCRWASPPFRLVLVVVINPFGGRPGGGHSPSRLGGPAPVPSFVLLCPSRSDCMGRRLVDALPPLFTGGCFVALLHGGCFATAVALVVDRFGLMLCRLGLSVRWMLCHLRARRPFAFSTMVYLLVGSVVWSGLGSWVREFPPPLFLLFLCCVGVACHLLGGTCNCFNSLYLLRFVSAVLLSS